MKIVPIRVWGTASRLGNSKESVPWAEESTSLFEKKRNHSVPTRSEQAFALDNILASSRIIVIEGISGSGKDTLQTYLKTKLSNRVIYDYTEGEVLHSWKQFQIEGILKLRLKFMKLFMNYVRDIVNRDPNAVFLLNRFHLSTYAWTTIQQKKLGREYDEIIDILRTLPVHVLILCLDENEIAKRSLHPERSAAWQKFQEQIVENYTFRERLKIQQELLLEEATNQRIPYSVIKLSPNNGEIRASKALNTFRRGFRMNAPNVGTSRRKRIIPQAFHKDI